jgi:hypothetical protein
VIQVKIYNSNPKHPLFVTEFSTKEELLNSFDWVDIANQYWSRLTNDTHGRLSNPMYKKHWIAECITYQKSLFIARIKFDNELYTLQDGEEFNLNDFSKHYDIRIGDISINNLSNVLENKNGIRKYFYLEYAYHYEIIQIKGDI